MGQVEVKAEAKLQISELNLHLSLNLPSHGAP
jgi:hypothetical protein